MKKKKQQYIYLARVIIGDGINIEEERYLISDLKIIVCGDGSHATHMNSRLISFSIKPPYNIKLKKGEQVRIPIDIEKAEVIK